MIVKLGEITDVAESHEPADTETPFFGCPAQMPEIGELAKALLRLPA